MIKDVRLKTGRSKVWDYFGNQVINGIIINDEEIDVSFAEIQNARAEQELLAEAGQDSFSSFKSMNATRWTSQFALTSSYSKNEGKLL